MPSSLIKVYIHLKTGKKYLKIFQIILIALPANFMVLCFKRKQVEVLKCFTFLSEELFFENRRNIIILLYILFIKKNIKYSSRFWNTRNNTSTCTEKYKITEYLLFKTSFSSFDKRNSEQYNIFIFTYAETFSVRL